MSAPGFERAAPVLFEERVDSTNLYLRRLADTAAEGTAVVAFSQTAGRGRSGRSFLSPEGGLYLSVPQYMGVEELGESGVKLRFCVSVTEENFFIGKRRLARDIRVLFSEKDVEIPFPQVVVHQGD